MKLWYGHQRRGSKPVAGRGFAIAALALVGSIGLTGCVGTATVQMDPVDPPWADDSSISRAHDPQRYSRVMIVPPTGHAGPAFEESLAAAERAFMRRGVTVISAAVTSRIILDREQRQQEDGALQLSDLERALVLAKESNADAVVQIGSWRWRDANESDLGGRYFVERNSSRLTEVDRRAYRSYVRNDASQPGFMTWFRGRRHAAFSGAVLDFTGRLVDVESGEVMASFSTEVPTVRVADPLRVDLNRTNQIRSASYSFRDSDYEKERRRRAVVALFDRMAALISGAEEPT